MKRWMRRWSIVLLVGAGGAGLSAAALAAPPPDDDAVEPGDEAADEAEPDDSPPPKGKPLTAAEIAALERVMGVHEATLTVIEKNRSDAVRATKALNALADAHAKVLSDDGLILAAVKKRMIDEDDEAAALSVPEALIERIDRSCGRWLALEPVIEKLLAHEPFGDALMRFTVPLL